MAKKIKVKLTDDHIRRFSKVKPNQALQEFIWNACDADATDINVIIDRNDLKAIEKITIEDNGHGIDFNDLSSSFGNLGDSYKKLKNRSPMGRSYHGKYGEGRYKGFSLGAKIKWTSIYKGNEGSNYKFDIELNNSDMTNAIISDKPQQANDNTGVTVEINEINIKNVDKQIKNEMIIENLNAGFASYMTAQKDPLPS